MILDTLTVAIGLGLVTSLLFAEFFGLAAGGLVVPGYIAMRLTHPVDVFFTLGTALLTFGVVRLIAQVVVVFGRRRTTLMILVGYLLGMLVRWATASIALPHWLAGHGVEPGTNVGVEVIGYIVPGLIAIWFDRQGVLETVAALVTASTLVRLVLIISLGLELAP